MECPPAFGCGRAANRCLQDGGAPCNSRGPHALLIYTAGGGDTHAPQHKDLRAVLR